MSRLILCRIVAMVMCLVSFATLLASNSFAATGKSNTATARALLKQVRHKQSQLSRVLRRASAATKQSLLQSSLNHTDSDNDDASDEIEHAIGSDLCDSDSDDDGVSDHDEISDDTDPEDPSEGYLKNEGLISAVSSDSITVGSLTCAVNAETIVERNDRHETIASLVVGERAELKCSLENLAVKIEAENESDDEEEHQGNHKS